MKAGILHTGLLGVAASFATTKPAHAVEGVLGRTITGTNITSYAGVVPPTPGFTMGMGYVHYSGDIGADRQVPVNNLLTLGLDATFDMFSLTGVYVWDTGEGRWNFASMAALPLAQVDVDANVSVGPRAGQVGDSDGWGLFDPFFAPVIAGYHFDQTHHLSLSLYVWPAKRLWRRNKPGVEGHRLALYARPPARDVRRAGLCLGSGGRNVLCPDWQRMALTRNSRDLLRRRPASLRWNDVRFLHAWQGLAAHRPELPLC